MLMLKQYDFTKLYEENCFNDFLMNFILTRGIPSQQIARINSFNDFKSFVKRKIEKSSFLKILVKENCFEKL